MAEALSKIEKKWPVRSLSGGAMVLCSSLAMGVLVFVFVYSMRVETLRERQGSLPSQWRGTLFSVFHVALYDADLRPIEQGASAEEFALGEVTTGDAYLRSFAEAVLLSLCVMGIFYCVKRLVPASVNKHVAITLLILVTATWASLDRRWSTGAKEAMERTYICSTIALLGVGAVRLLCASIFIPPAKELYCLLRDFKYATYIFVIIAAVGGSGLVAVAPVFRTEIRQWFWESRIGLIAWCCVHSIGRWATPQPILFVNVNSWYCFSTKNANIWLNVAEDQGNEHHQRLLISNWIVCNSDGEIVSCASHRASEDAPRPAFVSDVCLSDYGTTLFPYFIISDVRASLRPSRHVVIFNCYGMPEFEVIPVTGVPTKVIKWSREVPIDGLP